MEEKTKEQIIKEEFERANRCGEHIKDLKDLVVFMHEEIEFYRKKINLLDRELDDLSKGLKKENDELTEKVQELEAELAEAGTVIENKARNEKRLNETIIANDIQIEELKINNHDLWEKIDDQKERIEDLEKELCMAEGDRDELQEEVDKLTDRAERAEKEIREMKMIGAIEHDDWKTLSFEDETVVTINRKPDEIISVSVVFAGPCEEGGEEDE